MSWLPLSLWSVGSLLRRSRDYHNNRQSAEALRAVEVALQKIGRAPHSASAAEALEAHFLHGAILLALERVDAAIPELVMGRALLARDFAVWGWLAAELLRRNEFGDQAQEIVVGYLGANVGPWRSQALIDRLRILLRPQKNDVMDLATALRWNETVAGARPDLPWPYFHLAIIRSHNLAATGNRAEVARLLARCRGYGRADAMLAHILSQSNAPQCAAILHSGAFAEGDWQSQFLVGCAWRAIGNAAAAAKCFAAVDALSPLGDDGLLAFAEALINSGQGEQARLLLGRVSACGSARWKLLAATIAEPAVMLQLLAEVANTDALGKQATKLIVSLCAASPGLDGVIAALDAVPVLLRDNEYWMGRARALHAAGQPVAAISALGNVVRGNAHPVERDVSDFTDKCLAELYAARRYEEIVLAARAAPSLLAAIVGSATIIGAAILQYFRQSANLDLHDANGLRTLDELEAGIPMLSGDPRLRLLRGLLLARSGNPAEARAALEEAATFVGGNLEYWIQHSRAALLEGDVDDAAKGLGQLLGAGPRGLRIAAAIHAAREEWQDVVAALIAAGEGPAHGHFLVAAMARAGLSARICRLAETDPCYAYYTAVEVARAGDLEQAARWCAAVRQQDPLKPAAETLAGWLLLQHARRKLDNGDEAAFCTHLAEAIPRLVHDGTGDDGSQGRAIVDRLDALKPQLAAAYIVHGQWQQAGAALNADGLRLDARHCRNRGLYDFSSAAELAGAGSLAEAVDQFEAGWGQLCVALTDPDYLHQWMRRRLVTYAAGGSGDQQAVDAAILVLRGEVLGIFQRTLDGWGNAAAKEKNRVEQEAVEMLVELHGADELRKLGGLRHRDRATVTVGPLLLADTPDLHAEFARIATPAVVMKNPDGPGTTLLDQVLAADPARKTVCRLFSALGGVCLLESSGDLDGALKRLRARPWRTAGSCRRISCAAADDGLCDERDLRFNVCNPGFAFDGGGAVLRTEARRLEFDLLLRLAEDRVSTNPAEIDDGIQYWREALAIDQRSGSETAERIRSTALGRAKTLSAAKRYPEAIRLLEGVRALCGDPAVDGELASQTANVAILSINETGDPATGIEGLRAARRLNDSSTWIDRNLVVTLRRLAMEKYADDNRTAETLLAEALAVGRPRLLSDPYNRDLAEALFAARRHFISVRCASNRAAPDELLDSKMYAAGRNEGEISTYYHNRGVEKLNQGQFSDAIADLERALELEPTSDVTRNALDQARIRHGWSNVR